MVDGVESITGVAILICDGKVMASKPKPYRHNDIIHALAMHTLSISGPETQGFITSTGRFVSREAAVDIARRAGQIVIPKKTDPQDKLYSEDLW